jgi:predicted PurR-regulated permease PerM
VAGGVLFWLLGLPSPVLWGVVMFVLSILPLLGTWLIWLPAAAYLGMTGRWPQAGVLLGWGLASWFVVDNVIYVRLAGDRMRLHQVPALISFLGGLAVFGASGMILGPGILAVTVAVLGVWHRRAAAAHPDGPAAVTPAAAGGSSRSTPGTTAPSAAARPRT